jgi:hypothetical protein
MSIIFVLLVLDMWEMGPIIESKDSEENHHPAYYIPGMPGYGSRPGYLQGHLE